MGVGFDGQAEGTGETKISKLNLSTSRVYKQVLGLKISVENAVLMTVDQGMENLEQEALRLFLG